MRELTAPSSRSTATHERRTALVERLKLLVKAARAAARAQLEADGNGRRCAAGLSLFQDELIRLLYDYTTAHIYRATNPSDAERMAIVATGGYGRGLLAPGSDIDLLFLLPYKQTPWGESVAEYLLYILWDLGFKVGHATRTVEQSIKLAQADTTIRTSLIDMRLINGDGQLYEELTQRLRVRGRSAAPRAQFIEAKLGEREDRHKRAARAATGSSRTSRKARAACATCIRCTGSRSICTAPISPAAAREQACSRRPSSRRSGAARTSCGPCAATCTSSPAGRRSGCRSTCSRRWPSSSAIAPAAACCAVERFMKHYFLIAKDVGDLTTILCSALEMQQLMAAPRLNQLLNPLTWTDAPPRAAAAPISASTTSASTSPTTRCSSAIRST